LHEVAHQRDAIDDALLRQVGDRGWGGCKAPTGHVVRHHAVELLRHPAVETAETCLDVRDRDPQLRRGEGTSKRGVGVAVHEHGVGSLGLENRAKQQEKSTRLLGMGAPADTQCVVGSWQTQLGKECAGHLLIPVLARVEEDLLMAGAKGGPERRGLDELRAGPHDADDSHGVGPRSPASRRSAPIHAPTRTWVTFQTLKPAPVRE
jgi:hypothetical protein